MSRFRQLWRRIVSFVFIIGQTTRTLAALLTILTILGFGTAIAGYSSNYFPLLALGVAVFIVSVLLFIFLYTFILEVEEKETPPTPRDILIYPLQPPLRDLEILGNQVVYEYMPDGQTMSQHKRFVVRARRDGVASFTDRYLWTGTGRCDVRSITSGFVVTNERKEEYWNFFDVMFPRALWKDEEVDFTIKWDLFDEGKNAVPFLSTSIRYPTRHLIMQVRLPPELAPNYAYCYDFANYIDTLPIKTQEAQWDPATQIITYEVSSPELYHKYLIRWYNNEEDGE